MYEENVHTINNVHTKSIWCWSATWQEWILTAVPQIVWKRQTRRPRTSWLATIKNDLSYHNLSVKDATELALDRPLWRLLTASGAMHWNGASQTMMMMMI